MVQLDEDLLDRVLGSRAMAKEAMTECKQSILVLEPGAESVALRALKDHDNPDLTALHVALDPKSLLLTRS